MADHSWKTDEKLNIPIAHGFIYWIWNVNLKYHICTWIDGIFGFKVIWFHYKLKPDGASFQKTDLNRFWKCCNSRLHITNSINLGNCMEKMLCNETDMRWKTMTKYLCTKWRSTVVPCCCCLTFRWVDTLIDTHASTHLSGINVNTTSPPYWRTKIFSLLCARIYPQVQILYNAQSTHNTKQSKTKRNQINK